VSVKVCPQCGEEYELFQKFCSKDGATLTLSVREHALEGSVVARKYLILRQLGEGGMGQVYLAEHVRMKRKCALKVMRPQFTSDLDAITRFNREAANASRIDHPNVAAIYDFGEAEDGLIYLAMEYVDGGSLAAELERSTTIPLDRAVSIVQQVADALAAAWDHGITHRDLKPANIMLRRTKTGADNVKLVDFGISKVGEERSQAVTVSGVIVGTPEYMSPEQVHQVPLDTRSDVFSLGLVAFKMLSGDLPFSGATTTLVMAARIADPPLRLSQVRPDRDWGPSMDAVMARVLATNPDDRYQTAPDFAHDFEYAVRAIAAKPDQFASPLPYTPPAGVSPMAPDRAQAPVVDVPRKWTRRLLIGGATAVVAAVALFAARSKLFSTVGAQRVDSNTATTSNPAPPVVVPPAAGHTDSSKPTRATSFAFKSPTLRVRLVGLPPATRQLVIAAAGSASVKFVEGETSPARLVIEADSDQTVRVTGTDGEERLRGVDTASIRRLLPGAIQHDLAMLKLSMLDTPDSHTGVHLRFADNKNILKLGDEIQFRIRSDAGGYLTLLDIAPDGIVTVIHPSQSFNIGVMPAGREIPLPGPAAIAMHAALPTGVGSVRAIVTETPLVFAREEATATSVHDPALLDKILRGLQRASERSGSWWSTDVIPYTVRK